MRPNSPLKKLSVIALLTFGGLGASAVLQHADAYASNVPTTEMPINANHLYNLGETDSEIKANTPSPNRVVPTTVDETKLNFNQPNNSTSATNATHLQNLGVNSNKIQANTTNNNNSVPVIKPRVVNNNADWANTHNLNQSTTPVSNKPVNNNTVKPVTPSKPVNKVTPAKPNNNNNNQKPATPTNTHHMVTPINPFNNKTNNHHSIAPVTPNKTNNKPNVAPKNDDVDYYVKTSGNIYTYHHGSLQKLNATDKTPDSVEIVNNDPKVIKENLYQMYTKTLSMINNYRASKGLNPVTINYNLDHLANLRAQQIETNFSHFNSQGQSLEDLEAPKFHIANIKNSRDASFHMSENIAVDYLSPDATMPTDPVQYQSENGDQLAYEDNDSMFNHDSHEPNWTHRVNILNPYSTEIGIGCAYNKSNGTYTLAEEFYQPNTIDAQQAKDYIDKALAGIALHQNADNSALIEQVAHYAKVMAVDNGANKKLANQVGQFAYNQARYLSHNK